MLVMLGKDLVEVRRELDAPVNGMLVYNPNEAARVYVVLQPWLKGEAYWGAYHGLRLALAAWLENPLKRLADQVFYYNQDGSTTLENEVLGLIEVPRDALAFVRVPR